MSQNTAQAINEPIVADEHFDERDSAMNLSLASSTTSISSSVMQYRLENGRRYHGYKDGKYVLPNDDAENDRLDLQHHLFTMTFDNKLYTCPAGKDKQIHRVLDAGTGTGIWAIDFADEHTESEVVGVDLSPIQPSFVPPNVRFEIDDIEEPWTYTHKFDFIYGRMLTGSLADWPKFFQQCYENLNPGGWVEVADIVFPLGCDDGTVPADSAIMKWGEYGIEAAKIVGRPLDSANHYKEQLEAAGFVNVVLQKYKWPQNEWPKTKKFKEMGMWCNKNICDSLSGLSMALFTRVLGWTVEELEAFLTEVRSDFMNRSMHGYWPIYVAYGQKPE